MRKALTIGPMLTNQAQRVQAREQYNKTQREAVMVADERRRTKLATHFNLFKRLNRRNNREARSLFFTKGKTKTQRYKVKMQEIR